MFFLYNFAITVTVYLLKIIALFNAKIKLFVDGRKNTFDTLRKGISKNDRVIWMHTASLGEYEQGLPLLKKMRSTYPDHKILITFFSPSGFEVKKKTKEADVITYLPLDTVSNVKKFLHFTHPEIAFFVKYEIWPNFLRELNKRSIPVLLISAIFNKHQAYFKWYGNFMRKALGTITHFFVQDTNSQKLLQGIGLQNVTVSGDTRFDRVSEIQEGNTDLSFMDAFKETGLCLIAGSTWPEDEDVLLPYINGDNKELKFVLAPHNIHEEHIDKLKRRIVKKTLLYSEIDQYNPANYKVLIIDTIGLLTKIYSYADMAYVGGGFRTGLHNTLEPAVFGIPVMIGPNFHGFKEAEELVDKKGIMVVRNTEEIVKWSNLFAKEEGLRKNTGQINADYISANKGACNIIFKFVQSIL